MTVIELARLAGVTPNVVRYYTRIGLLKPTRNPINHYKQFCYGDVNCVQFIRRAQRLGFTLIEIAEIIDTSRRGDTPCKMVRETIQRRIGENRLVLAELLTLQDRMEHALAQWQTMSDGLPDGHAICELIEAINAD